jgi:hypothetical protein
VNRAVEPRLALRDDRARDRHVRYAAFQMAEVVISRNLFGNILRLIAELRPPPATLIA